jgi:hypothetical protein
MAATGFVKPTSIFYCFANDLCPSNFKPDEMLGLALTFAK